MIFTIPSHFVVATFSTPTKTRLDQNNQKDHSRQPPVHFARKFPFEEASHEINNRHAQTTRCEMRSLLHTNKIIDGLSHKKVGGGQQKVQKQFQSNPLEEQNTKVMQILSTTIMRIDFSTMMKIHFLNDRGLERFGINEHDLLVLEDILMHWVHPGGIRYMHYDEGFINIDQDGRVRLFKNPRLVKIPSSIGRLKHLQSLTLYLDDTMTSLPDEIGNLSNLVVLTLGGGKRITTLPFIGRLKALQELSIVHLGITSLPPSIGRLQNLQMLYLVTMQSLQFPDEFGNLGKLTFVRYELGLRSLIESLPSSIEYSLACSRFRSRALTVSPTGNHEWPTIHQNQWPIILENATHTFRAHVIEEHFTPLRGLEAHDAIYRLLLTDCYRESFVEMLINHNNQQNKKRKLNL